jgi:PKD repeat protein/photosystem II stability/assembly factor-like uncharacterized protein
MNKSILIGLLFLSIQSFAQYPYQPLTLIGSEPEWVKLMYNKNSSVTSVVEAYKDYYATHRFEKNTYTQFYKHWMMMHKEDNNGSMFSLPLDDAKFNQTQYLENCKKVNQQRAANWQSVGPFDFDKEAKGRSYASGSAHVYTCEQSFSNSNVLYAGTATAGVWKTTNKGENWIHLTKSLILGTVYALEIDRLNEDIVYFGGAGKVYKTINGGNTWSETGDATFNAASKTVKDIIQSPVNQNELWLAANEGLYHTTDAGLNWTLLYSGIWQEIEINPADPMILYAIKQTGIKTEFYKSTDGGLTFTIRLGGYPVAVAPEEQKRTEISVCTSAPNIIYAFATGVANGGSGLYGIYVSHDTGENWAFQCCGTGPGGVPDSTLNKNLCGWSDKGDDDGGQYYYDLAMEISPFDSNEVHVAGVNHWVSYDGGLNFICPSKWSQSGKVNYVHADIHDIRFYGNDWWVSCDGGIFYSETLGDTFNRKQLGIAGTDFWGFGMGEWEGNEVMVGGTYHNGTMLRDFDTYTNGWLSCMGGDNVLGAVNYGDARIIFSDYGRHKIPGDRTVDLINLGTSALPANSYYIGEAGDFEFHPNIFNTMYIGRDSSLWKTEDQGASYSLLYDFGVGQIGAIEVAPTNPNVIYAVYYKSYGGSKKIYKSIDAGVSWSDITPANSVFSNQSITIPFDIAVSSSNENELWLVRTQQSSTQSNLNGNKVFKTIDGGASWTNITTPVLDGEYITCIEHQRGTDGGIYIGTRRAVYYRNNTLNDWVLYNSGLPVGIESVQVLIDYKEGKVINATNQSVWESPLYEPSNPIALISVDKNVSHCIKDTLYFHDHSNLLNQSATSTWSFPGGNPSTSTDRNPKVIYSTPGTYSVSLTSSNANGTSSQTLTDFITVYNECNPDTVPGYCLSIDGSDAKSVGPSLNLNSNTVTLSAWIKPQGPQKDWGGIIFCRGGSTTSGLSIKDDNEIRMHWNGEEWQWSSGQYVKDNEWSHVALVIIPDSAIIYVNGIPSVHIAELDSEAFNASIIIGQDSYGSSRYFTGLIDEVCIYNRSLSQTEIRDLMHLTKKPSEDNSLVLYYQFNESNGPVLDKVGLRHAGLSGDAMRVVSTGPFGGGISKRLNISSAANYNFTPTGLNLDWTNANTLPNGEVVVSRINLFPDQLPAQNWNARSYWIIDNYGLDSVFDSPEIINFDKIGLVSISDNLYPNRFKLFQRGNNADGNTWNNAIDSAENCTSGNDGAADFTNLSSIKTSCQLDIINTSKVFVSSETYKDFNYEKKVIVYPTPISNTENLYIKTVIKGECIFELYSIVGQRVAVKKFTKETFITINDLAQGIYHYKFYSSDYEQNGEIVIQ